MSDLPFSQTVFKWLGFGRYNAVLPTIANGQAAEMQVDRRGRLRVVTSADDSASELLYDDSAVGYRRIVKASAGEVAYMIAANGGASDRWLHVFNASGYPADGSSPLFRLKVVAGQTGALDLPLRRAFATGIVWAVSSTFSTLTLDTGATVAVNTAYT